MSLPALPPPVPPPVPPPAEVAMVHRFRILAAAGLLGSRRNARSAASSLASERRERDAVRLYLDRRFPSTTEAAAVAPVSAPA